MKIIIAKSESENKIFWRIREEIPLAEKLLRNVIQHDVSLPLNLIDKFIEKSSSSLKKLDPKISIINFGHLGDNNLHFNVFVDKILDKKEYKKMIPYAWQMINYRMKNNIEFKNLKYLLKSNFPKFIN